jgi:branched-chain amino acid transport system ATP-binding protein
MHFGGLQALDDVSFDVAEGSVVGLIGPNGSGKTTLMNVISGVYRPSYGSVTFRGRRIADVPTYAVCKLGIARTFQVVKPFANLTVRENVAVGAMYGRDGSKRRRAAFDRAQRVARDRRARPRCGTSASDLTIPDRKRLEVAKALALDPDVLLLDEVMAGLNATEVDEALDLLRTVNARGVTLIVVEHLMKAIVSISTTIVVLAEGKKIAEGAPARGARIAARDRSVSRHALRRTQARADARQRSMTAGAARRRAVLRVENSSAGYGDTQVLWDVSLEIQPGEIVAIIGSNGAGKSTLLGAISGLVQDVVGAVTFAARTSPKRPTDRVGRRRASSAGPAALRLADGRREFADGRVPAATTRSKSDLERCS